MVNIAGRWETTTEAIDHWQKEKCGMQELAA